jgi:hypothetical protein
VGTIDLRGFSARAHSITERCPRCKGPLFVTGSADWGLCLTHGEQFIGVVPAELEPPNGRQAPTHLKRPGQLVGESYYAGRKAARVRRKRTPAEVEALNRLRREPVARPDVAERWAKYRGEPA